MPFILPFNIAPASQTTTSSAFTRDNQATPNQSVPVAAQITVGNVDMDDQLAQFDPTQGGWTDWMIKSHYERDDAIYMGGMTSPRPFQGASVGFVQLNAPTLLWIVQWTGARLAAMPVIPDPTSVDPNWVLMDRQYEVPSILLAPDGVTPLYRISGTYVYGHRNPNSNPLNDINFGRPPWIKDVFDRQANHLSLAGGLITVSTNVANQNLNLLNPIGRMPGS